MGRPLNKKYFGNRNIGTTSANDNYGIGGEGVASVTIGAVGSYTAALPTVTFSAPNFATGITATGTVHGKAISAVATAAGTGYHLNDVLYENVVAGNVGTYATFNVTGLTVVGITINNGGSANDVGDEFTFSVAGFSTPLRVRVTAASTGTATAVSIINGGVWTTGSLPANTIGMTRTQVAAGQDYNGTNLQVNITAWGVATVSVNNEGDYTAITGGAKATTVSPSGGTGATLTITYGIKSVAIDEKGSGYTSTSDAAITFSAGVAAGTSVLTTDSGNVGSATNQENAIIAYAWVDGGREIVDIVKQSGSRRYTVRGVDGIVYRAKLKGTGDASANGEMDMYAYDTEGNTYYVIKLTERRAYLMRKSGGSDYVYANGESAPWSFAEANGAVVKINNA